MRFSAVVLSHIFLHDIINIGDIVVDATAGNGFDTVFMCELTGPEGTVIAIDIQKESVDSTQSLLSQHGIDNAICKQMNHAFIGEELAIFRNRISCILFNLGYLPGSQQKDICTNAHTTLAALEGACSLLNYRGTICVIAYKGHPQGKEEYIAVETWMKSLDAKEWHVVKAEALNQHEDAPVVFIASKKHD